MPPAFTEDSIFRGKVKVFQPPRGAGYRFSLDSLLLAHFAAGRRAGTAVDIGAGCGVVGFVLLFAGAARRVFFIERNGDMVRACRMGIEANGFGERGIVVRADIRKHGLEKTVGKADMVVCNPPYRKRGAGWEPSLAAVASAKHETTMEISDVIGFASGILTSSGRLLLIASPERLDDIFASSAGRNLRVARMRFVHSKPMRNAGNVLLELKPSLGRRTAIETLPPLCVMREDGSYTPEVESLLMGKL